MTTAQTSAVAAPLIRLEGISKTFGPVKANQDIHLDIAAGRVLALLGENGAGKSTLMNMLSGRFQPDSGRIVVDGTPTVFASSRDAIEAGIGMVYQHFMLVNTMTVAQNVLLGQEGSYFLRPREMERRVAELAERFNLPIDPSALVADLSMGERQRVEILKLLMRDSRVLIFDEPTAVLTPTETPQLFAAMREMTRQGKAVVFISHKMEEIMDIADDVAILRKGRIVDTMTKASITSKEALASRMVGRDVMLEIEKAPAPKGRPVLEIEGLSGNGMDNLTLTLTRGEIVAVVGVAGNGQKELVETITGQSAPQRGSVKLLGKDWKAFYTNTPWMNTISYIPEDRLGLATCPELDLIDNVLLTTREGFAPGLFLDKERALGVTKSIIRRYHVQPPIPEVRARQLSGGNLQKLVLGREFLRQPKIIVAEQPSQGLDVSATEEVWHRLLNARMKAGVLLVTGDLNEALQLADRVAVMFRGRFMDVFDVADTTRVERIGQLMAGVAD
ncbi:simple sugar transport system ATP-binding protein [Desulfobaculum xiamenense]|uniref:Simple sugar transport system ATP-binding protein n=1 Tax=Desulfobaculum xiamenense TaxID=995050 RepID=A0A846QKZ1_9BACT|nr:ABC transporter ATP-binding protein [Desulfobaculum xiamenense]NJB68848.1 simple sugar transport system ATP-binding protein [Desulfobaculum xiamenense]